MCRWLSLLPLWTPFHSFVNSPYSFIVWIKLCSYIQAIDYKGSSVLISGANLLHLSTPSIASSAGLSHIFGSNSSLPDGFVTAFPAYDIVTPIPPSIPSSITPSLPPAMPSAVVRTSFGPTDVECYSLDLGAPINRIWSTPQVEAYDSSMSGNPKFE